MALPTQEWNGIRLVGVPAQGVCRTAQQVDGKRRYCAKHDACMDAVFDPTMSACPQFNGSRVGAIWLEEVFYLDAKLRGAI